MLHFTSTIIKRDMLNSFSHNCPSLGRYIQYCECGLLCLTSPTHWWGIRILISQKMDRSCAMEATELSFCCFVKLLALARVSLCQSAAGIRSLLARRRICSLTLCEMGIKSSHNWKVIITRQINFVPHLFNISLPSTWRYHDQVDLTQHRPTGRTLNSSELI